MYSYNFTGTRNSPRRQSSPGSSSGRTKLLPRNNLNSITNHRQSSSSNPAADLTIDIFIPSADKRRLASTKRSRRSSKVVPEPQPRRRDSSLRFESPSTTQFPTMSYVEPYYDPLVLCTYSTLFSTTGASAYWIKRSTLLDVFPRVCEIGLWNLVHTGQNLFIIDCHISCLALEKAPTTALVAAHDFIFEHIIGPSPMFDKVWRRHHGYPGAVNRICADFHALSIMLCRSRGLGCGSWLLYDFGTAMGQLWEVYGVSMSKDQQTSMFVAHLAVLLEEIQRGVEGFPNGPLAAIYNIWSNLSAETKFTIRRTVELEEQEFDTENHFLLKEALYEVIRKTTGPIIPDGPPVYGQKAPWASRRYADIFCGRRVTEGVIYEDDLFFTPSPRFSANERRWDTDFRNGFRLVQPLGTSRSDYL